MERWFQGVALMVMAQHSRCKDESANSRSVHQTGNLGCWRPVHSTSKFPRYWRGGIFDLAASHQDTRHLARSDSKASTTGIEHPYFREGKLTPEQLPKHFSQLTTKNGFKQTKGVHEWLNASQIYETR